MKISIVVLNRFIKVIKYQCQPYRDFAQVYNEYPLLANIVI